MLLVGLGNPGTQYNRTRHNIGFMFLDSLDQHWQRGGTGGFTNHGRVKGEVAIHQRMSRKIVLLKPMSYMNLSGGPVQTTAHFYKIPVTHLIVVCDDVNLPFGTIRIRNKGGAGGHNGLKSIESSLGTQEYVRMRLGVGGGQPGRDLSGHVLGDFRGEDMDRLEPFLVQARRAVESMLRRGVSIAMSQFNGNIFEESDDADSSNEPGPARANESPLG